MRRSPTAIGMGSEMLGAAQQVGQEQLSLQTTSDQELRALIMAALGAGMAPGEVDGTAAAGAAVGVGVAVGAGVAWVGAGAAGDSAGGTGAGVGWGPFWAWPPYSYNPWLWDYSPEYIYPNP